MNITIYRRHSGHCPEKANRYAPRCGCPLWFQFVWKNGAAVSGTSLFWWDAFTNLKHDRLKHHNVILTLRNEKEFKDGHVTPELLWT
jgi:hypothetical protein